MILEYSKNKSFGKMLSTSRRPNQLKIKPGNLEARKLMLKVKKQNICYLHSVCLVNFEQVQQIHIMLSLLTLKTTWKFLILLAFLLNKSDCELFLVNYSAKGLFLIVKCSTRKRLLDDSAVEVLYSKGLVWMSRKT